MTDTPQGTNEIADYRIAVERHLSDLPAEIRDDLLSDLEAHLTEVAAELEPGATLADRLGSPEAYARELRETAETENGGAAGRLRRSIAARLQSLSTWAGGLANRYTTSAGVGEASEFRKALKPGWWVVRGVLAAALFIYIFLISDEGLQNAIRGSGAWGAMFLALIGLGFVWLSLRLGARSERWRPRYRRMVAAGGIVLLWIGVANFSWIVDAYVFGYATPATENVHYDEPYSHVTDVYAYNENGELIEGVYLFDQEGQPLWIGDPWRCEGGEVNPFEIEDETTRHPEIAEGGRYGYLYPICPAPDTSVGGEPEPTTVEPAPTDEASDVPTDEPTTVEPTPAESPTPGE